LTRRRKQKSGEVLYVTLPTLMPMALPLRSGVAPLRCSLSYDATKISFFLIGCNTEKRFCDKSDKEREKSENRKRKGKEKRRSTDRLGSTLLSSYREIKLHVQCCPCACTSTEYCNDAFQNFYDNFLPIHNLRFYVIWYASSIFEGSTEQPHSTLHIAATSLHIVSLSS